MPWFVIRVGPEDKPSILMHTDPYVSWADAERASYDDSRLVNAQKAVDQSTSPFIVEAKDSEDAILQWLRQLGGRHPRHARG
jgi:hypothetical protein